MADLYEIKGPGGRAVVTKEQAQAKKGVKGFEIIGPFVPKKKADKKGTVPEETGGDSELLAALEPIKKNAELAAFIEENDIDIDPSEYSNFDKRKEAVQELLEASDE